MIALLSALVTACALLIPLQQRAIDQASAHVELDRAPDSARILQLQSTSNLSSFYVGGGQPGRPLTPDELYDEAPATIRRAFRPPIGGQDVDLTMPTSNPRAADGALAWREGACAHLTMVTGDCPDGAREIAVSTADAENFGWDVGTVVRVQEDQPEEALDEPIAMSLTVVGTYRVPAGTYWETWTLTGRSGTKPDPTGGVLHDLWLTDRATFETDRSWRYPTSRADLRLRDHDIDVDDLLTLSDRVGDYSRDQAKRSVNIAVVKVRSGLPAVADAVRKAQHQARVTIPALMVPLGALGLVVLWMALGTAVEQRRPEVAVARLRGRGARGAQLHLVRELLTTVLIGVPVGIVLAFGVSWPARHLMLPGRVPWEVRGPVWLGLLLSLVVLSVTVVLVTTRVSREPIVDLMRRIPARRPGWGLGTADAVIATVSASILVSFVTGRLTGPIALVAPALLALGGGLVLARLLVPAATRAGRKLVARGRIGPGVGLLQLARRPGVRATTALLTVAAAILVFAGDAVAVGSRTRTAAAAQRVGASVVLTVSGGTLSGVRQAVAAAEVPASEVTPVVVQRGVSRHDQTVLYVEPARFGSIGSFPDRAAARDALRRLTLPTVDPIRVSGRSLSMAIGTEDLYAGAAQGVGLSMVLLHPDGTVSSVAFGTLPTGTSPARRVTAPIDCATGCTLTGWKVTTGPANAGSGRIVLSDLRTDNGGTVPLGTGDDWHGVASEDSALDAEASGAGSLTILVDNSGTSELDLEHRWIPPTLPTVVAGSLPAGSDKARFTGRGLDGVHRPMGVVARLPWLPSTGPNAAIADLDLAERSGSALADDAALQLWFSHDDAAALARVRSALEDRGMDVAGVARTSDARREIDESAAAWSLDLGVLVAVACLVVALLGLAIAVAGTWRARARDLAVLRLNGVALGDVRRIAVVEQVPPTVAAVLLGSAVGVLAAHYALPTLPLLAVEPDVDVIDLSAAWVVVLALATAAIVVLGAFGWAAARSVATAATPPRVTDSP